MADNIWVTDGEQFTCNSLTEAIYVGKRPYGTSYGDLKVYCPALMKNIAMGPAKRLTPVSLNKSMFCNSNECAITPMSKVVPLNYITAKSYYQTEFQLPHLDYGVTIVIRGNDHDFQSVNITTNKDPSVYHK